MSGGRPPLPPSTTSTPPPLSSSSGSSTSVPRLLTIEVTAPADAAGPAAAAKAPMVPLPPMSSDAAALLVADANEDDVAVAIAFSDTCNASKIAADADAAALHAMHDLLKAERAFMPTWETLCEAVLFYTGATNIPPEEAQGVWNETMASLEAVFDPPSPDAVEAALAAAHDAAYDEEVALENAVRTKRAAPAAHVNDAAMIAAVAAKFDRRQCMGPGEEIESLLSWAGSHPRGSPGADGDGFRHASWEFLVLWCGRTLLRQGKRMAFYGLTAAEEGALPSQA